MNKLKIPYISKFIFFLITLSLSTVKTVGPPPPQSSNSGKIPINTTRTTVQVQLYIAIRNLPAGDVMCIIYTQSFGTSQWTVYHKTEVYRYNNHLDFKEPLVVPYSFGERQPLMFRVYYVSSNVGGSQKLEFYGFTACTLGQIISNAQVQLQIEKLHSEQLVLTKGFIAISADVLKTNDDLVFLKLSATNIRAEPKTSWFRSENSNLSIEIYKNGQQNTYESVYKTEAVVQNSTPQWKGFTLSADKFCDANNNRKLKFVCWNRNSNGECNRIGEFETTLSEMKRNRRTFPLMRSENKSELDTWEPNSATIHIDRFEILSPHLFAEHVKGGLQIRCVIGIDFTASNGHPLSRSSLHYTSQSSPSILNAYEKIMHSILSILEDYSYDQQFPVFGFGARLDDRLRNDFHVNMDPNSPFCSGVTGVLKAYRDCLRQKRLQLFESVNLAPIFERVVNAAQTCGDSKDYFVVLILIHDGFISDREETIRAITKASRLPISIVVVGIGYNDFNGLKDMMEETRSWVQRDTWQFVSYAQFHWHADPRFPEWRLAREVLTRVCEQSIAYLQTRERKDATFESITKSVTN